MTAVSLQINRGVSGTKNSDITVGTTAPGAGDIQLSWQQLDANGKHITRHDLQLAVKAFLRAIQQGGATVQFTTGVIGPP